MCGILVTNNPSINSDEFKRALGLMIERGPDAPCCIDEYGEYKLGHNRLKILDLDQRSNQPFYTEDGRYCIVFNGEIYNFRELAKQHELNLKTTCDTEVLLSLFEKYGPKMLNWLNGMFAFVIFDKKEKKFFIARDRLGIKPLYYNFDGKKNIFSSEICAIVELIGKVSIDEIGERQYRKLRAFFNGRTIYNEIKEFPAGYYMLDNKMVKYWELENDYQEPPTDEELKQLIISSVEYRGISDVSVGSYLSGGLDSTIVTALSKPKHTWTIGFEDSNEFKYSNIAAKQFNTIHNKITIDKPTFLDNAKYIIKKRKEPISVPNQVLIYSMTKEVKKHNTVILSGEGADELFFGYDRIFSWAYNSDVWDLKKFSELYSYGSNDDMEIVEDALSPFLKYKKPIKIVSAFFQIAHLKGLLSRLDSATMLCSVEARCPFLDYRLIERLAGVHYSYKTSNGIIKAPLKRIFSDLLPYEVVNRRKVGFPVNVGQLISADISGINDMDKWFQFNIDNLKGGL